MLLRQLLCTSIAKKVNKLKLFLFFKGEEQEEIFDILSVELPKIVSNINFTYDPKKNTISHDTATTHLQVK